MALAPFLSSIIDWLRAGYPEGVPGGARVRARLAAGGWPLDKPHHL